MNTSRAFYVGALTILAMISAAAPASALTLSNTSGGDGYVQNVTASSFDLFGANNGVGASTASYMEKATKAFTFLFDYTYTSHDVDGSAWDPAGYTINGVSTQLSPGFSASGFSVSGSGSMNVAAGDSFGFYVHSADSGFGRGELAVSYSSALSAVPLPASAPMFGAALLALGAVGYGVNRRKASAAA